MRIAPTCAPTNPPLPALDERELRVRVRAEYWDMPGLTLTLAQAARLFDVDRARCERVLGSLVDGGVLVTDGTLFARADTARRFA